MTKEEQIDKVMGETTLMMLNREQVEEIVEEAEKRGFNKGFDFGAAQRD